VVRGLTTLPMVLPPVVGGIALLLAYGRRGFIGEPLDKAFGISLPFTLAGVIVAESFVADVVGVNLLQGAARGTVLDVDGGGQIVTASAAGLSSPPSRRPRWRYPGNGPEGHEPNTWAVMQLSARNQIPARITSIRAGEAIANVHLDANGVEMVASVTMEAVQQLGLTEGTNVTAVIKASDVILATGD
jgi:molybdopterin-binding protein